MKIITVTLNPAMDKTVYLPELKKGGCNRIQKETVDAGGKGINVSKTLQSLGGTSVAVTVIGGSTGQRLKQMMEKAGLEAECILVEGETRINLKIAEENGILTEVNEPGPEIGAGDLQKILQCLENYADGETLFVLSGSIPRGVPADIYAAIIALVHRKKSKVLLDTSGEALKLGLQAKPDIIKPNKEELCEYLGQQEMTPEQLREAGQRLIQEGIGAVIISMGKAGALFLTKEESFLGKGLKVEVHSTVGAGDAMAAAVAYGTAHEMTLEQTAKLAMAVSAGAVMTYGTRPAEKEIVEGLLKQVQIEKI